MNTELREEQELRIAGRSLRGEITRDVLKLSIASALAGVGNFASAYFGARFLGPIVWGIWQGTRLVLEYGANLHLGVQNGMHREIPILRGKGEQGGQHQIAETAFGFTSIIAALSGIMVLVAANVIPMGTEARLCLQSLSVMLPLQLFHSYFGYLLRAYNLFDVVARGEFLAGITSLLTIPLVMFLGLIGFLTGQVVRLLTVTVYYGIAGWCFVGWGWNSKILLKLLGIGFPIMLMALVSVIFSTIDRMLVLTFLDTESLGYYSLGVLTFTPLLLIFTASNSVMYPRFAERYGALGDTRFLQRYISVPLVSLACVLSVVVGIIWIVLPVVTYLLLPNYVAGLAAARLLLFGLFFYALAGMPGNMLLTVNKQMLRLLLLVISASLSLILSYVGLSLGYGLVGIAGGTTAAYLIFFLISTILALHYSGSSVRNSVYVLARTLGPVCLVITSALLVEQLFGPLSGDIQSMLIRTAAQGVTFLGMTWGLVFAGLRTAGLIDRTST
jgi:O-antigen/teichoic acid export membrane protein